MSWEFCTFANRNEGIVPKYETSIKVMKKIFSVDELVATMKAAKAGGQYVTLYGESDYRMNKFPTDGSQRERIRDGFQPRVKFSVKFHFGEDYEKRMSKITGEDYKASDSNRIHLVKNVIMQFVSTGTTCFIYMPESYKPLGMYLDGEVISDEDRAYAKRYQAKSNSDSFYRNLNVKNIEKIVIGGEVVECMIGAAAVPLAG